MNKAYQKQIEHDEKIQHLYEKLLEKAEAQGFKFKNGVSRELIKKGQEDETIKSEKQVLVKSIDIYRDDVNEGEGANRSKSKFVHRERDYSEISQDYDEIQSLNTESRKMKNKLCK